MEFDWWKFLGDCSCLLLCKDKALQFYGRSLEEKAIPCEGVVLYKLEVASVSKILRFYGVETLSFEVLRLCESTTRRFVNVEES